MRSKRSATTHGRVVRSKDPGYRSRYRACIRVTIACARVLLDAPDAIFAQCASHNAFTIAAVHTLGEGKQYEFQCLHGMGETVYDQVVGPSKLGRACRIYARV